MKVCFFSSEVFPFAKTGGLADVSGALPPALAKEGVEVKMFMPLYKNIRPQKLDDQFASTKLGTNIEIIFVKHDDYFNRDYLYGTPQGDYPDNLKRFSFFCKKSLEFIKRINFIPDIFHANDWQASLVNIYLKTLYRDQKIFKDIKSVLTIHNLAYQGLFHRNEFPTLGIDQSYFSIDGFEYYGKINLLKGGIVFSDIVNTVSPTYAQQIKTQEYGCGLDGVLRQKGESLCGILNAIDYNVWDPKKDKFIYKPYNANNFEDKYVNKKNFQKELGLEQNKNTLLLGMVSRLAEQKGIDILSNALNKILKKNQVIILGLGDLKYHKILQQKAKKFKNRFSLNLKFDETLAHRIYASCDAFLMPSRFEPCGLSQMISYKYATVPIVHQTGGLIDTVRDYEQSGGGFAFSKYSGRELLNTIERTSSVYAKRKEWSALLKKITKFNFSWTKTAKEYIGVYERCQSLR
jgi:starch synthase